MSTSENRRCSEAGYRERPPTATPHRRAPADADAGVEHTTSTLEPEADFWNAVEKMHGDGMIQLVTSRRLSVEWLRWLLGRGGREDRPDMDFGYRVNFASMQKLRMRYHQYRLIKLGIDLDSADMMKENMSSLDTTLRDYVQAVQDYDYMKTFTRQTYDPFIASSERYQDHHLLDLALYAAKKDLRDFYHLKPTAAPTGPWERRSPYGQVPIGGTRNAAADEVLRRAFWVRIGGALVGGAFLIVPMWVFALSQDMVFLLGGTTVCVLLFGVLVAFIVSGPEAVFAATLAYAAVLMVFVGVVMEELGEKE